MQKLLKLQRCLIRKVYNANFSDLQERYVSQLEAEHISKKNAGGQTEDIMTAKYIFACKRQRLFTETKKVTTEIFMTTNIHCSVEHFHFSMNRPDLLAVLVCLFGFIIFNINYILLETIGVPLCQQQLGSNNVDTFFTIFHREAYPD